MRHPPIPTASEVMVRKLVTLRPEMSLSEATAILLKHKISGAPVVDAEGRLKGLLSEFDCLRALASSEYNLDAHDDLVTVGDLMTESMHTISPEMDLFAIAHEFVTLRVLRRALEHQIRHRLYRAFTADHSAFTFMEGGPSKADDRVRVNVTQLLLESRASSGR